MSVDRFLPKIQVTFSPLWWHHHYGMDFSRDFWVNPILRTERERDQRRLLFERFGNNGLGERDPQAKPVIGIEYGDRFMAALWGCDIIYMADQEPAAIALSEAAKQMRRFTTPDVFASSIVKKSLADGKILLEKYGSCEMFVNYGGPINNAVSVLGEEILVACLTEPELAQRVLHQMGEAILQLHDEVVCRFNGIKPKLTRSTFFGLGNCPVCMISPKVYRNVIFPVDLWLRNHFRGDFLLHHDGLFHPYNEVYQPLRPTWVEVGWGTDLQKVRQAFPAAKICALIEVSELGSMNETDIERTIISMVETAGPPDLFSHITIYDIGPDVPDSIIQCILTLSERMLA